MKTTQYIAINSPRDFYFVELPSESIATLPGSSYSFIPVRQFIDRIIEKYPGTLRDLAAAVETVPQLLFFMGTRGNNYPSQQINENHNHPRPNFISMISYDSAVKLIKAYYKFYLNTKIPE